MNSPFKMYCKTEIEKYRRDSFWTKEPETLAWIDSFRAGDIFYDIGANVGMYSLYAASRSPFCHVYAFEPMPANYYRLIQNTHINGFQNIHIFNFALGNKTCLETLYIPHGDTGKSGAQTGRPINEYGEHFVPYAMVTVPSMSLARFIQVFNPKLPNHIKIDVDGHEGDIIAGLSELLFTCKGLKSMLVECNEGLNRSSYNALMYEAGFTVENEFNRHENHSRYRRMKEGITAENVIFTRRD